MQIYNTITMKFLTLDERLDILLTLKHTVKVDFNSEKKHDIENKFI
jgi:hypothetical protein